jgi:hypothetical protein
LRAHAFSSSLGIAQSRNAWSRNCCIGESRWYFEMRIVVLVVFLQVAATLDIQSSELSAGILYFCVLYVQRTA